MVSILGKIFDVSRLALEVRLERPVTNFTNSLERLAPPVSIVGAIGCGVDEQRILLVLFRIRIFLFNQFSLERLVISLESSMLAHFRVKLDPHIAFLIVNDKLLLSAVPTFKHMLLRTIIFFVKSLNRLGVLV